MTNLTERFIGTLQELNIRPGYTEREYHLNDFGSIGEAAEAAMTDIIATLAMPTIYLVRISDKVIFKVQPVVVSRTDYGSNLLQDLWIKIRSIKPTFSGDIEESQITLWEIMKPTNRLGYLIYERTAKNTITKSEQVFRQLNAIIDRFAVAIEEDKAQAANYAARRRAEAEQAAREREERRAQRQADEARRAERRAQRQAIEEEEAELAAALEAGDQETLARIAAARAERFEADMNARAAEATQAAEQAANNVQNMNANGLPDGTDTMSFIYGWLAANVDYLYAKLPGWDRHAESSFTKRYPGAPRTEKAGEPGYSVTDKDKRTSGGYKWQLANEYHVHFRRGAVQKAPECVRTYLGSIRSKKTGEASQIKGNISSNALAQHLIVNLDFYFDRTENTNAYNTCRNYANDKESFELGYNWDARDQRTDVFNPEVEADVNPLNQDFPEANT